jgi:hypothetical protein
MVRSGSIAVSSSLLVVSSSSLMAAQSQIKLPQAVHGLLSLTRDPDPRASLPSEQPLCIEGRKITGPVDGESLAVLVQRDGGLIGEYRVFRNPYRLCKASAIRLASR